MPGLALRDRFESFLRLLADTNEFIAEMPAYRKRDGAAIIYAFNSLFDIAWKLMKDSLTEFYGLADVKPSPRDVVKQERWGLSRSRSDGCPCSRTAT